MLFKIVVVSWRFTLNVFSVKLPAAAVLLQATNANFEIY